MLTGEIIVRGQPFRCHAPVKPWTSTGLHFLARMRHETRWVINHWTGAENAAPACFANMLARGMSVHFIIDQLGEIYQCADADALLAHCKGNGGNHAGVGIEIISAGHGAAPARGFVRPRRTEKIHGARITYGEFFPAQIGAAIALNEALCRAYDLPMQAPLGLDGDVYPDVLTAEMLSTHRGIGGHLHFDDGKPDPGLDLLRKLHAHGVGLLVG